ncbi:hypothetical protein HMPREF0239_04196 [Clostridium sp. ATCC BAA-442]|uniref:Uncharacterized protein n=1 Tax=Flavonifractor plautii ATCC 29863 TaxID=411475 RepID=G9YTR9_FLAPL|nr:hypothetical protein HMPREF0372_02931 [Flavonifractor plautii ATCC 29863]ERI65148.1 hypothetical protein HMPREF0239_04196 [Clostridium sp. ATCC BAA-442]
MTHRARLPLSLSRYLALRASIHAYYSFLTTTLYPRELNLSTIFTKI